MKQNCQAHSQSQSQALNYISLGLFINAVKMLNVYNARKEGLLNDMNVLHKSSLA